MAQVIDPLTLEKYKTLQIQLIESYGNTSNPDPDLFLEYLEKQANGKHLIRPKMQLHSACYKWGIEQILGESYRVTYVYLLKRLLSHLLLMR